MTPVLEAIGIEKRFGSVLALDGADFVLNQGSVHGLLGENGAGKSTLMRIAFGLEAADRGVIRVGGEVARLRSPKDARRLGIGMVHQHFTSVPAMTVRENLWLAAGRYGRQDKADRADRADPKTPEEIGEAQRRLRDRLWVGLDPNARAEDLAVGAKQRLEILQALASGARILLLDEPTAALAPPEVTELLDALRDFGRAGGSVVFITHKLGEVLAAVDQVTVLRRGRVTFTGPAISQTAATLTAAMVGEGVGASGALPAGIERSSPDAASRREVVVASGLTVSKGEIVGIAAVEGNGQRELLRAVAGVVERPATMNVTEPVGFIPEDRTTEGLIPAFSLAENLVLGLGSDPRWAQRHWIRWPAAVARTSELIAEFSIRTNGPESPVGTLSGGNQQKLVLARALEREPPLVVAENPTRGLDVQATAFVHDRLRRVAREGAGVLVYSTDLDEVLGLADRILVMYRGDLRPVAPGSSREVVGAMMLGTA